MLGWLSDEGKGNNFPLTSRVMDRYESVCTVLPKPDKQSFFVRFHESTLLMMITPKSEPLSLRLLILWPTEYYVSLKALGIIG